MRQNITLGIKIGLLATLALLGIYFLVVSLISGASFAAEQFSRYWYFIASLAVGFGIQMGLYIYLRRAVTHRDPSGKVIAVTGTTSTAAMIACCAHYAANILPVLGVAGIATAIAGYQIELFWIGLALNFLGIAFIVRRINKFHHHEMA